MTSGSAAAREPQEKWDLVIVVDGDPPVAGWGALLDEGATVIAADGGARYALAEGVLLSDVVGDFDSLSEDELTEVAAQGARIHPHPTDKDFTDFELAAHLAVAASEGVPASALLVVGGAGGRIDHELGNIAVLAGPTLAVFAVTAFLGDAIATVVRPGSPVSVSGEPGRTVSLVPVGGTATGVKTRGLVFPLDGDDLEATSARGISNRIAAQPAAVSVDDGVLLLIEPGTVADLFTSRMRRP